MRNPFQSKDSQLTGAISKSLAINEFEPMGNILSANESFCQVTGYAAGEIVRRHHCMFGAEQEVTSDANNDSWFKLDRGRFGRGECRRLANGGRSVWIQASRNTLVDSRRKVTCVVALMHLWHMAPARFDGLLGQFPHVLTLNNSEVRKSRTRDGRPINLCGTPQLGVLPFNLDPFIARDQQQLRKGKKCSLMKMTIRSPRLN